MTGRWLAGRGRTVVALAGRRRNGLPGAALADRRRTGSGSARSTHPPRLVAAATPATSWPRSSRAALDSGRRFCFLMTDATNPTANYIYREIGYELVRDVHVSTSSNPPS